LSVVQAAVFGQEQVEKAVVVESKNTAICEWPTWVRPRLFGEGLEFAAAHVAEQDIAAARAGDEQVELPSLS